MAVIKRNLAKIFSLHNKTQIIYGTDKYEAYISNGSGAREAPNDQIVVLGEFRKLAAKRVYRWTSRLAA